MLEQLFQLFAKEKDTPISVLMVKVGMYFKDTPYVVSTLEDYLLKSKSSTGIMVARPK